MCEDAMRYGYFALVFAPDCLVVSNGNKVSLIWLLYMLLSNLKPHLL